jgi:hypothetical protein
VGGGRRRHRGARRHLNPCLRDGLHGGLTAGAQPPERHLGLVDRGLRDGGRRPSSTELGGVELPEGAKLFLWLAATGHDADVFPEPGAFDPARENAHHNLAFGKGIHYCAGATLGKLEARLALAGLMDRWPELRLVEDQTIPFHPNTSFRGPLELWVSSP